MTRGAIDSIFSPSTKIDLFAQHPYKDWEILGQKKVKDAKGRDVYSITFAKERDCVVQVACFLIHIALAVLTIGLLFFSEKFRNSFRSSLQKRRVHHVLSSISIQQYLWKRIKQSKCVYRLYLEALKAHQENQLHSSSDIKIRFCKRGVICEGSKGAAVFDKGEILLELGNSQNSLLSTLVFELTNFKQQKQFYHIDQQVLSGKLRDPNRYAKKCEEVEYKGAKIHNRAVRLAIAYDDWDPEINVFEDALATIWKTFSDFWKAVRRGPHAGYYRKVFHELLVFKQRAS